MPCFHVTMRTTTETEFFVEADSAGEVESFLEDNEDFDPLRVKGLVEDDCSSILEESYAVEPTTTLAVYRLRGGELVVPES